MGKGDKRTKRGKIAAGTFGNARKHKSKSVVAAVSEKKSKSTTKKKSTAKSKAKSK